MKKKYRSLLQINSALTLVASLFFAGFLAPLGISSVQRVQAGQTVQAGLAKKPMPSAQTIVQTVRPTQWLVAGKPAMSGADILKLVSDGKYQEAQTLALARINEMPNDIDAYVALSWSLLALGKTEDAENYARRGYAIYKDPRLAQAIGEASYNLGKNDVALTMLQEYIAAYPEGPKTGLSYYLCGELYVRKAQFMHADIAFSTAVRYNPNNPLWWTRVGWARENAHRPLQALSAYEQALALNPNFQDAIEGRKRILSRLQQ